MSRTCVVLVSGGLDSMLALKLMARMDLRVLAFHGLHVFEGRKHADFVREHIEAHCLEHGAAEVHFRDMSPSLVALTKTPKHGYGKHLNACLDCRLNTIRHAKSVMDETGADFLVSGEVLGQRPKSQLRKAMEKVDAAVAALGLEGLLLRPLCAKHLEPTIPEREGWVDREQLLDFQGRTRTPQMQLAAELGIQEYSSPAGGCLLTDPNYCARLADLMRCKPDWTAADAEFLKLGRHLRVAPALKVVATRNEAEGDEIRALGAQFDTCYVTADRPGALCVLRRETGLPVESATPTKEELAAAERIAAGLAVYYSKYRAAGTADVLRWNGAADETTAERLPAQALVDPQELGAMYLGARESLPPPPADRDDAEGGPA